MDDMVNSTPGVEWGQRGEGLGKGFENGLVVEVNSKEHAKKYRKDKNDPKIDDYWDDAKTEKVWQWRIRFHIPALVVPGQDNGLRMVTFNARDPRFRVLKQWLVANSRGGLRVGDLLSMVCVEENPLDWSRTYGGGLAVATAPTVARAKTLWNPDGEGDMAPPATNGHAVAAPSVSAPTASAPTVSEPAVEQPYVNPVAASLQASAAAERAPMTPAAPATPSAPPGMDPAVWAKALELANQQTESAPVGPSAPARPNFQPAVPTVAAPTVAAPEPQFS